MIVGNVLLDSLLMVSTERAQAASANIILFIRLFGFDIPKEGREGVPSSHLYLTLHQSWIGKDGLREGLQLTLDLHGGI